MLSIGADRKKDGIAAGALANVYGNVVLAGLLEGAKAVKAVCQPIRLAIMEDDDRRQNVEQLRIVVDNTIDHDTTRLRPAVGPDLLEGERRHAHRPKNKPMPASQKLCAT